MSDQPTKPAGKELHIPPCDEQGVSARGWPRPRGTYAQPSYYPDPDEPKDLPVPWVVEVDPKYGVQWTAFHDRCSEAHDERLCQVCGEKLGRVVVLGNAHDEGMTSGPGCHPRCFALAMKFCPHFAKAESMANGRVAFLYEGSGLGYEDPAAQVDCPYEGVYEHPNPIVVEAVAIDADRVRELARTNPLGT